MQAQTVYLVGGFGQLPYLHRRLIHSLEGVSTVTSHAPYMYEQIFSTRASFPLPL
jgi:hypothetical protein